MRKAGIVAFNAQLVDMDERKADKSDGLSLLAAEYVDSDVTASPFQDYVHVPFDLNSPSTSDATSEPPTPPVVIAESSLVNAKNPAPKRTPLSVRNM